ncbi:MAG: acetyl-CoA hydrolase/transferase family protein [Thermovirgaceae bacterium]
MKKKAETEIESRLRIAELRKRLCSTDEAAKIIKSGMTIGCSGFTPSGYPKAVPLALAARAREEGPVPITLWAGASVGPELDGELTKSGCIARRYPYQTEPHIRRGINSGHVAFADYHLSMNAQNFRYGFYGSLDLAIIEAVAITEEGHLIPSTSVGNSATFVSEAEKVIVELNTSQPLSLEGIHDIYVPLDPPDRQFIPLAHVRDRIGLPWIQCGPEKIAAIVLSNVPDSQRPLTPVDETSRRMAQNLLDFLDVEVKADRMPPNLLPLQSGVGNVANAVLSGLKDWPTDGLLVYTEVIQDAIFDLFDSGKLSFASGTALTPSPECAARIYGDLDLYRNRLLLRPQEISNHPEIIRRLGVIAMNTAVEVDIYGHVNSTMAGGTQLLNGIGGSGDFTRNAYLSIFLTPSTAKSGKISKIVPFCSHVDHTEHDVDVIVTEQGVADLRGLSPRERAKAVILNCSDPDYRGALMDYYHRAKQRGGHEPHLLEEAFSWHLRLRGAGTMQE